MIRCTGCGKRYSATDITLVSGSPKRGFTYMCSECDAPRLAGIRAAEEAKSAAKAERAAERAAIALARAAERSKLARVRRYGLTADQLDRLTAKAKCDICGRRDPRNGAGFCVDHCHETGAVRGFLCSGCNSALGLFRDSPDIMRRALDYLTSGTDYRLS